MTAPVAYGIDFGTTNSLVTAAYPDRVDLLAAEGRRELIPSIIYLHRDGIELAGDIAVQTYSANASIRTTCSDCALAHWNGREYLSDCRWAKANHGCHNARLISEIKAFLADDDLNGTHSWGVDYSLARLTSVVIGQLKRRADAITGSDVRRAVVGHPVAFAGAEGRGFRNRQRLAIQRLTEAMHLAGFDEVELLEEPAAAVSVEESDGVIVALDFGGGTFDVAVINMGPDAGEVLAMQGVAVGGEDFDEALFRAKLWDVFDLGFQPGHLGERVCRRSGAVRALSNDEIKAALAGATKGGVLLREILYGGFAYELFQAIERAKIDLSSAAKANISFDRPGLQLDVEVTRREFERLIRSDIDAVFAQISKALRQAGLQEGDIDLVVRTGGSSSIPLFVDRLQEMFPGRVVERPPYDTIATGLGLHARKVWT